MVRRYLSEKRKLQDYGFVDYKNGGNAEKRTKMRRAMKRTCKQDALQRAWYDYWEDLS